MNKQELLAARVAKLEKQLAELPRDESGKTPAALEVPLRVDYEAAKRDAYEMRCFAKDKGCIIIS